jgi:hypothetical protein
LSNSEKPTFLIGTSGFSGVSGVVVDGVVVGVSCGGVSMFFPQAHREMSKTIVKATDKILFIFM